MDLLLDEIFSMDYILIEGVMGLLVVVDSYSRFVVFEINLVLNFILGFICVFIRLERVVIEGDCKRVSFCLWKRLEGFIFGGFVYLEI